MEKVDLLDTLVTEENVCYLESFEYLMIGLLVRKIEEVRPPKNKGAVDEGSQTLLQPAGFSGEETGGEEA